MKLTESETKVLTHLANAWNEFCKLENIAENDANTFMHAIHEAQARIALRVARRVDPEFWRTE